MKYTIFISLKVSQNLKKVTEGRDTNTRFKNFKFVNLRR